jgi:hypothetical protein
MAGQVNGPQVDQPALDISLTEPVVPIPSPPTPETQIGVKDVAAKTINDWLAVKQKALGETHDTSGLNTILVDPVLREYQNLVASAQQENWYFTYEHTLEVTNVEPDDPAADELLVQAEVKEIAKNYDLGLEDPGDSYDKTLSMQYTLIRQDGKWFIKDMNKLN